jgi:hypothetical protein
MSAYFTTAIMRQFAAQHQAQLILSSEQEHGGGLLIFPNGQRQYFLLNETGLINSLGNAAAVRDRACGAFLLDHFGYKAAKTRLFPYHETQTYDGSAPRSRQEVLADGLAYAQQLGWPVVLKSNRDQEQRLVRLVNAPDEFADACQDIFQAEENVLIQPLYRGNSYCCIVLEHQVEIAYQQPSLANPEPTTLLDLTETIHLDYADICTRICRDLGLNLGGVELIAPDITQPLSDYVILQVDHSPSLLEFATLGERVERFYLRILNAAIQ